MNHENIDDEKRGKIEDIESVFQDTMAQLRKLHEDKLELIRHCRKQHNRLEAGRLTNGD